MSDFTEAEIQASLDGTFSSVGGRRVVVPRDFIPSHENTHIAAGRGWMTEAKARAILQQGRRHAAGDRAALQRQPQHRQRHFKRQDMEAPAGGELWLVSVKC